MWWKAAKATPENVEKTRKGLISKSNFARAAHFFCRFLCRCFARLQGETSRNRFMEEISYVFSFTAAHFLLALVDASISHFVTAATKFSCSYNKKMSPLFFISRSRSLSPFLSLSFAGLPLFLSLFHALYSKFVDMTIHLSVILEKTRIQKQFSLSGFVFIDSLAAPALRDAGGYAISRQNNLELHLGCHACWLSYFTLPCLWCGRTVSRAGGRAVGVRSRDYQIFSVDYHIFLSAGAPRRALLARELRHDCLNIWANTKMSLLKPPKIICVKSLKITKKNLPATLQKSRPDSFKILCDIERISLSRRHS